MLHVNRTSLRARMTVAVGAIAALISIGVGVLLLVFVGRGESEEASRQASDATDQVHSLIKQGRLPSVLSEGKDDQIQVLSAHGQVVAATPGLLDKRPMATFRPVGQDIRSERTLCPPLGLKGCMAVLSVKSFQPDGIWPIYTATPELPWYGSSTLLFLVVGGCLLMTTMVAAGTFRVVARTLAPVDAIRLELAEITATGLDRRVPVAKHQEIRLLAETVNATLDRLEAAYVQLRHFTSDASHDLRSPIAAIRVQVEESLMYPDDSDWSRTATEVLCGVDRLQAIVADLLALARLDAGASLARDSTDLAQLVDAELDRRHFTKKVVRNLHKGTFAHVDRLRISRLLTNLLDNAERHATSQITVIVRHEGSTAYLEVIDDGAGIAPELREMVFKRFTRLDASRNRDAGGTGLGLAIARQIAEAHQGTLTIEDNRRGARFVLGIPAMPSPTAR